MQVETFDFPFLPVKQTHEMLPTISTSRCGEIFVTNNADKWIFVCAHCQMGTNDIGVFICHIKIDHLNSHQGLPNTFIPVPNTSVPVPLTSIPVPNTSIPVPNTSIPVPNTSIPVPLTSLPVRNTSIPVPLTSIPVPLASIPVPMVRIPVPNTSIPVPNTSIPVPNTSIPAPMTSIQEVEQKEGGSLILKGEHSSNLGIFSKVSKIVDISLLTNISESESLTSYKNTTLTSYPSQEPFTQTTNSHSVQENKEVVTETFGENTSEARQETISIDEDEDTNDSDNGSIYSPNEDNSDDSNDSETNDGIKARGTQRKRNNLEYNCDICNKSFEFKRSLDFHINKHHKEKLDENIHKCENCKKTFRSAFGLQNHIKTHNTKCPICQYSHKRSKNFLAHIMTHESDTCFPCQVCGKMYTSKEEHMEHWKTHAEALPFPCDICHRRFREQYYLKVHMKYHFQYQCKFCPNHYNAAEVQKQPYVCRNCENIPEVKERIQLQRILEKNQHVFESDEDSILSSNSENMDIMRNDYNPNKESENDSSSMFSNYLNSNEENDHDVLNNDDTDLEFLDEVNDDIGASSSATKTSPMDDDNSQQKLKDISVLVERQPYKQRIARRQLRDASNPLELPESLFQKTYKVNKPAFRYLFGVLTEHARLREKPYGIAPVVKLSESLRFFAEGSYHSGIGKDRVVSLAQSTFSKVLSEVVDIFDSHLCPVWIKIPESVDDKLKITSAFYTKHNIPGVVGCIDGTLIPPMHKEKRKFCLNVMLLCDHELKIRYVDPSHLDGCKDSFIWNASDLRKHFEQKYLQGNTNFWLLGDTGYPLEPWLLTPYLNPEDGSPEMKFNEVHLECRNIIKRTNRVLINRWRCLLGERELRYDHKKAAKIVNVCCALHNICIHYNVKDLLSDCIPLSMSAEDSIQPISNQYQAAAQSIRDNIKSTLFS